MNTNFSNALKRMKEAGFIPVIPDIKCISPKVGDLLQGRAPVEIAALLADAGAPAISVVTETMNFGGSLELLEQIAAKVKLPILRKDFIKSIEDLHISKELGAESVLLICSTMTYSILEELYGKALQIGLEPLVETHTVDEMGWARKLGARLVGINNRNILELEMDSGTVETTKSIALGKTENTVLISESSIKTPQEGRLAIEAGADAILVGTALWKAKDMYVFYQELSRKE